MTKNHFRLFLTFTFCGIAAAGALWFPGENPPDRVVAAEDNSTLLTIGSKAPAVDIEHWIQDGGGFFTPVTAFENGKVYVVEFWATWCGPCVSSMPHLAELQTKYRGRDVQVVSVSDEPLETVSEFLKRETKNAEGEAKTFEEITSAYSLTTDPDRSVHMAYMEAAEQPGIPTAFLVGKDGHIEWIGHPMEMDEPLEKVVADSWDRVAFAKTFNADREFNTSIQQLSRLMNAGKVEEALAIIEAEVKRDIPDEYRERWSMIRQRVKVSAGMIDEEVISYFKQELTSQEGNAIGVTQIALFLKQAADGNQGLDELLAEAITAMNAELEGAEDEVKPLMLDTLAHLYETTENLDAAIESQQKAVEITEGRTKTRLSAYLDELKEKKAGTSE
jgi:thiol-disulfide isomerase/thioredoxin